MKRAIVGAVLAVVGMSCGLSQGTVSNQGEDVTTTGTGLTWEQFRATKVFVEPETGVFIADHDTPFFSEKQLREFYELNVRDGQLIVNRIGSADDKWTATQKVNLTYCVSNTFNCVSPSLEAPVCAADVRPSMSCRSQFSCSWGSFAVARMS